jgi:hypothetical protein
MSLRMPSEKRFAISIAPADIVVQSKRMYGHRRE